MSDYDFEGYAPPDSEEWQRRVDILMADEVDGWWWLSFVHPDKSAPFEEQVPGGGGFAGICLMPGGNVVQAASFAHLLSCNPGGEVAGFPLPYPPKPEYQCRLFTGDDAKRLAEMEPEDLMDIA